jgi:hypothetical protein
MKGVHKVLHTSNAKIASSIHPQGTCVSGPCALTEHHAMKAYWGVEI